MWVVVGLLVFVFYLLWRTMVIIPTRKAAVLESMGSFSRVLKPGIHFIMPWETLRRMRWSYPGQSGEPVKVSGIYMTFETCQMDLPPLEAASKDNIRFNADFTLFYAIKDFYKAIYENTDIVNLFAQVATQAMRNSMAQFPAEMLRGNEPLLGERIRDAINAEMAAKGIQCERVAIQKMTASLRVSEEAEAIYLKGRQLEATQKTEEATQALMLLRKENEHRLTLMDLKYRQEIQARELEISQRDHNARMAMRVAELKAFQELGFTHADIIAMEQAKNLRHANTIYAPLPPTLVAK